MSGKWPNLIACEGIQDGYQILDLGKCGTREKKMMNNNEITGMKKAGI
jgi:hypothetical protein